ncbi:hypothetical protein JCGZ_00947 [Jatropha curcas]|uniref:Uncharacterized protein n=1 Tax=Jatropha curcas TaxID=180498 RepID=A0A067L3X2_JATCU|nr:hypothetical protein JCGZ_00947 [Jatropha curcas]
MSCFTPEKKPSTNKTWKGFKSTLQKKLIRLKKPKPLSTTRTTQSLPCHHHHDKEEDGGACHDQDGDGVDSYGGDDKIQLKGVDASAEEFIQKMKRRWKLERQRSEEKYFQTYVEL